MLNELAFVAYNPRAIQPENFTRLQDSIRRHTSGLAGWDARQGYRMASSITVNQNGMRVVGGEQLGVMCYGVEILPEYCDVIRRRWAEFTHGPKCNWKQLTKEAKE